MILENKPVPVGSKTGLFIYHTMKKYLKNWINFLPFLLSKSNTHIDHEHHNVIYSHIYTVRDMKKKGTVGEWDTQRRGEAENNGPRTAQGQGLVSVLNGNI